MIVTMNSMNSDKYLNLFTESYEFLKSLDNGYVDINKDRFSSLAEYYSHMADFFENQKYKYVMLPLDEDPFIIDLNTRSINVPTSFVKCASVQSDQLAETIVFVADRYFDYMDLANAEIYVQWTIPENKKNGVAEYNGATRVEMIDLESEPGKIKFAWPLNDKITEFAGNVRFSVRFFRIDDDTPNKLLYSLNTLENVIVIKEALQPSMNADSEIEAPVSDDSFKKAILNSIHAEEGVNPPVQPVYFTPGSNIDADTMIEVDGVKIVSLDNNNGITLRVQAIVADAGEISYKWYYKEADGKYYDCENYPETFDADGEVLTTIKFGEVKDAYLPIQPQPTERVRNERYYESMGEGAYKLYTGVIPAEVELFERYSTLIVPSDRNITGHYKAAAWNNINLPSGKTLTTLYPTHSDACLLPGPAVIAFKDKGNLKDGAVLTLIDADENLYNVSLVVAVEEDSYQPKVSYEWRKSAISADEVIDAETEIIATTDVPHLDVSEPGWYSARVVSELNREQKYLFSNICKVTHKPLPPIVEPKTAPWGYVNKEPVTFDITARINNPEDLQELLMSEGFTYVWQIAYSDTNEQYVDIPVNFAGVSGLGTPAITVNDKLKATAANFRCLVVNNLNGERAVFDHSGIYQSNGTLGDFKAEAPYIYEDSANNFVFTAVNF